MQLVVIIIQIGQQTYHYPVADGLFAKSWLFLLFQFVLIYYFFILYNFFIQNIKFRDFSDVHRQMNKVLKYYNNIK